MTKTRSVTILKASSEIRVQGPDTQNFEFEGGTQDFEQNHFGLAKPKTKIIRWRRSAAGHGFPKTYETHWQNNVSRFRANAP